ncbi:hypothetical protein CSQ79_09420 [Gloeocapsopsis sp. IPPAS B-1203]|nr:hypothetical protein CSQ79_09420 [Gloeocapsopsis sp. IPPAS B-1203]
MLRLINLRVRNMSYPTTDRIWRCATRNRIFSQWQWRLVILLILLGIFGIKHLPSVAKSYQSPSSPQATQKNSHPVLLGLYTPNYLGSQRTIDRELRQLDDWAGKRHSLAGFFMDIEDSNPAYNITNRLELLRSNGYTAFINLDSTRSAAQIARGDVDKLLRKLAQAYAVWTKQGSGRMAFIAPFQEMNIPGETYSKDPQNFKLAYQRLQKIFAEAGVAPHTVRWVFAPNGWSENAQHRFENYYPGSERVDIVAFSAYNWGHCHNASWKKWSEPQEVFESYIQRMRVMAPGKPIFIAQTGSTSHTQSGAKSSAKDQWLRNSYTQLVAMGVRGIIYFNIDKECDWAFYNDRNRNSVGYRDAIANSAFSYVAPADLARMESR